MQTSPRWGLASTWSERHSAHAAGLGTFGLCDGLITPVGKAVRVGSVVARLKLPPTPRPYDNHRAWCLFFAKGKCMACAARCPVGAISEKGKDKKICRPHLKPASEEYVKQHFGFDGYGCGLCQTKVPCESGIPRDWTFDRNTWMRDRLMRWCDLSCPRPVFPKTTRWTVLVPAGPLPPFIAPVWTVWWPKTPLRGATRAGLFWVARIRAWRIRLLTNCLTRGHLLRLKKSSEGLFQTVGNQSSSGSGL